MRRILLATSFILASAVAAAPAATAPDQAIAELPLQQLPNTPSLDAAAMDRSIAPCEDLYQFSGGGWMKSNPIPAYGSGQDLAEPEKVIAFVGAGGISLPD